MGENCCDLDKSAMAKNRKIEAGKWKMFFVFLLRVEKDYSNRKFIA